MTQPAKPDDGGHAGLRGNGNGPMKKPIQIGLKWLLVSCLAVGTIVGYVGMQVRNFNDMNREGLKIEDYLALHAKPETYVVYWYLCEIRIRDPQFGDEELRGLTTHLVRFPGEIRLDVRGTSITKQGLLQLQDVKTIIQLKVCSNSLAPEDAPAMKEMLGIKYVEVTQYDPSKTGSVWDY
jgi:hypothetical protein